MEEESGGILRYSNRRFDTEGLLKRRGRKTFPFQSIDDFNLW